MQDFRAKIINKLNSVPVSTMDADERAIMSVLFKAFNENLGTVKQKELAKSERWLQCHPEYREEICNNNFETVNRGIRRVVMNIRHKYYFPILSSNKGYWICRNEHEAKEFMNDLECEAKAQTKAWFATYRAMSQALDMESQFFEQMQLT